MKKIVVLGCGLVGSTIARDLVTDPELEVTAADIAEPNLDRLRNVPRVSIRLADLSDPDAIRSLVHDADAVVGAVPGRLGDSMLRTVIEAGKPIADISFSPESPLEHDALARENGVTAVVDCGVSPGMSNLAVGHAASRLDIVRDAVIYVGGLPLERHWPYEYRIVFSATDVIEEYTRPARMVEHGEVVVKEALSEVELLDFPGVGTLEAFNTDGLRTLLRTVTAVNMREKTLRYPGHADRMRMLRETGFFSEEEENVDGVTVVPRRLTEKLLFSSWIRRPEEQELTLLLVDVQGDKDGHPARFRYELLDRTDPVTGTTSMARTTGFPCSIMAQLLARGEYVSPGVRPPELFASDETVYRRLVDELANRGVMWREGTIGT